MVTVGYYLIVITWSSDFLVGCPCTRIDRFRGSNSHISGFLQNNNQSNFLTIKVTVRNMRHNIEVEKTISRRSPFVEMMVAILQVWCSYLAILA